MCFVVAPVAAAAASGIAAGATATAATTATAAVAATTATAATAAAATTFTAAQGISLATTLLSTGLGIASAVDQSKSTKESAKFNKKVAETRAVEERSAGAQRAGVITRAASRLASKQRAALGSSGFDVNRGDAVSIVGNTLERGAFDADIARVSGRRASNASLVDAELARQSGKTAGSVAGGQIAGTLLQGTGAVSSQWYRFTR